MTRPEIDTYIADLVTAWPAIESVWLLGSRANNAARPDSDWDLLLFADGPTLTLLAVDVRWWRVEVDLLVVYDGDAFQDPWRDKAGSLADWRWEPQSDFEARYLQAKPRAGDAFNADLSVVRARRLWARR